MAPQNRGGRKLKWKTTKHLEDYNRTTKHPNTSLPLELKDNL